MISERSGPSYDRLILINSEHSGYYIETFIGIFLACKIGAFIYISFFLNLPMTDIHIFLLVNYLAILITNYIFTVYQKYLYYYSINQKLGSSYINLERIADDRNFNFHFHLLSYGVINCILNVSGVLWSCLFDRLDETQLIIITIIYISNYLFDLFIWWLQHRQRELLR